MATKNCKFCNKQFKYFPAEEGKQFCSRKCNQDYRVKTMMESGKASKGTARTYLQRFVDYKCNVCEVSSWQGQPLTLQLEHKDGNPKNNVIDNICWLCPNCHSQTATWGSKNASPESRKRMMKGLKLGWQSRKNKGLTINQINQL